MKLFHISGEESIRSFLKDIYIDYRHPFDPADDIQKLPGDNGLPFFTKQEGVIYFTETLTLLDNLEDNLLLATGDKTKELTGSEIIEDTFLLKLASNVSISSYQEIVSQFNHTAYN